MDEANTERIITPMSKSLVEAIDDFRFTNRVPSRSEAIRQLMYPPQKPKKRIGFHVK